MVSEMQMRSGLKTITIVTLVLGLAGIILGISVGLYRSDQLAKLQEAGAANPGVGISSPSSSQTTLPNSESAYETLLHSNLHTILLAVGTLLTLISATLFLIGVRNAIE